MKASIQTKFFVVCIFLVLLTTAGISTTYYILTKQDKQREFQQRIHIAFDIILDDLNSQIQFYTRKFNEFLQTDRVLTGATEAYNQDPDQLRAPAFVVSYFARTAESLKNFGYDLSAHHVALYGADRRLLAVYQRHETQDIAGIYATSETDTPTFLLLEDPSQSESSEESLKTISSIVFSKQIPDSPLPSDIEASYKDTIPDNIIITPFNRKQQLGIQIIAPVFQRTEKIGVLIGEFLYTQQTVEQYASRSRTDVNFFGGQQLGVGTLPAQTQLEPQTLEDTRSCEEIMREDMQVEVAPFSLDDRNYYQGICVFRDAQQTIGAITVNLSRDIEKQAINKLLTAILTISVVAIGLAFGLSAMFSRKTIRSIHHLVHVVGEAAEGDLRPTAVISTQDEIGMLATKLNQMIAQLRSISGQVQQVSYAVKSTADTIFQQMDTLTQHVEQQSDSVDSTTIFIENIKKFIDTVARNTNDLLSATAQILASIQQTRASIEEVTSSTGSLTTNLYVISASVTQVNETMKQVADHTGRLAEVAQKTEREIHQIDHSLKDVSLNADQAQQLAKETMDAATHGQTSVDASIQGMSDLKRVVTNTARIIQEINTWSEKVSSILDIVDGITEQTSLLALNASIISAQAGVHGRGFAVVADEIKELATRTKTSTQEIGTLIHELQRKTGEGVHNIAEGLDQTEQGIRLASAVKEALDTILESATRSSKRAADTARVTQQTTGSSQAIRTSMTTVTEMVSQIKTGLHAQEHDIEQVASAVENLSGMAEEVNHANIEQKRAAEEIERSMQNIAEQFNDISYQTETLQHDSDQMVTAMHTVGETSDQILQHVHTISGETVKSLTQQSDLLQKIVSVFKIS